jgi:hypothetical protein
MSIVAGVRSPAVGIPISATTATTANDDRVTVTAVPTCRIATTIGYGG